MAVAPPLPQDALEVIFDKIRPSYHDATLKNISLVSKEWRTYSQRRIFRKLHLSPRKMRKIHSETFKSPDLVGTTRNMLQQQSQSALSHVQDLYVDAWKMTPQGWGKYLDILPLFTNVTSLWLSNWRFQKYERHHITDLLCHFGPTVTTLELHQCFLSSGMLTFLTPLFPHVDNLLVHPKNFDGWQIHNAQDSDRSSGAAFRGNLTFKYLRKPHQEFLAYVNEHSSDLNSISVLFCTDKGGELQRLFNRHRGTLTSVGFGIEARNHIISLSSCDRLRTLSIYPKRAFEWDDPSWNILLTIASSDLEEIDVRDFSVEETEGSPEDWETVDNLLCQCYDRSRAMAFRVNFYPWDLTSEGRRDRFVKYVKGVWPNFLQKGIVNVVPEKIS